METKIKVVGLGGSGGNAVSRMMKLRVKGVELIAINTDAQDLEKARANLKIRIGEKITQGLGAGMDPEVGKRSALESKDKIVSALKGADIIFITGGLGGGTCTGTAPVVAEIARNNGALTIAVVTLPFSFEGSFRRKIAQDGLRKLKEKVDSLIVIENDKLLDVVEQKTSLVEAFWFCDNILRQAVLGISDLITKPGIINVDFADVKSIMENSGTALFGVGVAKGEKRAEIAASLAINSPLLNTSCRGAKGVLFNVAGGKDLTILEIEEIAQFITKEINPQAKVIFGAVYDFSLPKGQIKVTMVATGF